MSDRSELPYRLSGALLILKTAERVVALGGSGLEDNQRTLGNIAECSRIISSTVVQESKPTRQELAQIDEVVSSCLGFLLLNKALMSVDDCGNVRVGKMRYSHADAVQPALT